MSNHNPKLIYVCAYHQEAIAIIEHHKLKRNMSLKQFAYYSRDHLALIETGTGKQNAAIACAYIAGKFGIEQSAWLNIGIAGHRTLPIGQGVLCNKVTDGHTGINYYPHMGFKGTLHNQALITVDQPENNYVSDSLYDMEASGFFLSSSRFSTLEHIHCYKIVSDNEAHPIQFFNKNQTRELIAHGLPDIESLSIGLIESINSYQEMYRIPEEYKHLIQKLHFTATQQEQLKTLLKHWHALSTESLLDSLSTEFNNSKQLLNALSKKIDNINFKPCKEI